MNILFLTLLDITNIDNYGLYEDLLRELYKNGHEVYVVSPSEKKQGLETHVINKHNCKILKVKTGNIQKTNIIEKGISTILLEKQFKIAIKKEFSNIKFDLIFYSTPPITLVNAINYVKERDKARTYLLLKDIFPQNAVDLGMISKTGLKGLIYKLFRRKEKKLYQISDRIGCMSQANVNYVLKHNPEINKNKVEIFPNCIEPRDMSISDKEKRLIRNKYGLPIDKTIFVYGGNLGKPQGIDFLIKCLRSQKNNLKSFFLIIGDGTEYSKLEKFMNEQKQENVKLLRRLPKEDYDKMIGSCDVGMIFLDYRFTIPNFPSRLLSYMQAKLPILAVTDTNSDIGEVIEGGKFGWWCESKNVENFNLTINKIFTEDFIDKGKNAYDYLLNCYSVNKECKKILNGGK